MSQQSCGAGGLAAELGEGWRFFRPRQERWYPIKEANLLIS
jgi:hypothetical protein